MNSGEKFNSYFLLLFFVQSPWFSKAKSESNGLPEYAGISILAWFMNRFKRDFYLPSGGQQWHNLFEFRILQQT